MKDQEKCSKMTYHVPIRKSSNFLNKALFCERKLKEFNLILSNHGNTKLIWLSLYIWQTKQFGDFYLTVFDDVSK